MLRRRHIKYDDAGFYVLYFDAACLIHLPFPQEHRNILQSCYSIDISCLQISFAMVVNIFQLPLSSIYKKLLYLPQATFDGLMLRVNYLSLPITRYLEAFFWKLRAGWTHDSKRDTAQDFDAISRQWFIIRREYIRKGNGIVSMLMLMATLKPLTKSGPLHALMHDDASNSSTYPLCCYRVGHDYLWYLSPLPDW